MNAKMMITATLTVIVHFVESKTLVGTSVFFSSGRFRILSLTNKKFILTSLCSRIKCSNLQFCIQHLEEYLIRPNYKWDNQGNRAKWVLTHFWKSLLFKDLVSKIHFFIKTINTVDMYISFFGHDRDRYWLFMTYNLGWTAKNGCNE